MSFFKKNKKHLQGPEASACAVSSILQCLGGTSCPCTPIPPCSCPPEPSCPCPPESSCPCPPEPSCPCPPVPPSPDVPEGIPDFYAQYGVTANPESGGRLPFQQIFNEGSQIVLEDAETILLPEGYLYLINFLFLATPEANGYYQVTPELNGTLRLFYSFFAPAGEARNASAAGSFTTIEAASGPARLAFRLTYSQAVRNIDISGAVSVTPLRRL